MDEEDKNKVGRPGVSDSEKQEILSKLEPYLKSGLSVRKALREAAVPNATFYRLLDRDDEFREQIGRFQQYISILLNSSLIKQLQDITKKQSEEKILSKEDLAFVQWFATNSNLAREEFGERKEVGLYDPEAEIHRLNKLIEENSKKDIDNGTIK